MYNFGDCFLIRVFVQFKQTKYLQFGLFHFKMNFLTIMIIIIRAVIIIIIIKYNII